jgi:hypothetical protein
LGNSVRPTISTGSQATCSLITYDAIMQAITRAPAHAPPPADQDAAHWLCYDAMRAMIQRAEALDTPARIWVVSTEA